MKSKKIVVIMTLAVAALTWNSCKKEEQTVAPPDPENEVITTVKLAAVNNADVTDVYSATWKDLTPNDGNPDTTDIVLKLKPNAVYTISLLLTDETKSPVADITSEVQDRGNYHLICYTPDAGLNVTVERTDHDTNTPALEIGIKGKLTTGAASTGKLRVTLHHQPSGKNGTNCDLGSTDADVSFTVKVQ
jgi:hypothetical protein